MLRSFVLLSSLVFLAILSAGIISCSSSSGGATACTGGPYNVVGDWTLSSGGASGPGVINSSGLAVFFETSATVPTPGNTVVMPTISGACSFSGTATSYNTPLSGGGTTTTTATGNVTSDTSISGTVSNGTAFTLTPNSALSGSPTALSGSMLGEIEGWTGTNLWQLSFSPAGTGKGMSFSGSDSSQGCTVSGTFSQEGGGSSTLNVFDVSITYFGTGCPTTGTVTGLGFESNTDYFDMNASAPGTYLYAASSSSASVFEIFQQQAN